MPDLSTTGCLPSGKEYNFVPVTEARQPNLRERLRRYFFLALLTLAALAALAFGLDYCVFKIRALTNHHAYGSVMVNHYYAVAQKNGKTGLYFDPPAPRTCVNALFPHAGAQPCWYLSRHPDQRTDI